MMEYIDLRIIVGKCQESQKDEYVTVIAEAPASLWNQKFGRLVNLEQMLLAGLGSSPVASVFRGAGDELRMTWAQREVAEKLTGVESVGHALFEILFPPDSSAERILLESCQRVQERGRGIRLKLELHPSLSNLPWEMIRCPLTRPVAVHLGRMDFSVVRFLGETTDTVARSEPGSDVYPTILILMANPAVSFADATTAESFYRELNRIENTFKRRKDRFRYKVVQPATAFALSDCIEAVQNEGNPVVGLHFIGHGGIDAQGPFLCGEDITHQLQIIRAQDLLQSLRKAHDLQWATLNACNTAFEPVGCPLAGLATSLAVIQRVPTVIAYRRPVQTADAEALGADLFRTLLEPRKTFEDVVHSMQQRCDCPGGLVILMRSCDWAASPRPDSVTVQKTPRPGGNRPAAGRSASSRARTTRMVSAPAFSVPKDGQTLPQLAAAKMIHIPSGPFKKGLTRDQIEKLLRQFQKEGLALDIEHAGKVLQEEREETVEIPEFWIDETPVTNAQFDRFVQETGYRTEAERAGESDCWRTCNSPHKADHPVVYVTCTDAEAFCRWTQKRLPTEDEWKKACRGPNGMIYPWGDVFSASRCNTAESQPGMETTPVRKFPNGASSYGCLDMVGNVEEWTGTLPRGNLRAVLGGSWCMTCQVYGLAVLRRVARPSFSSRDLGFRCARDSAPGSLYEP